VANRDRPPKNDVGVNRMVIWQKSKFVGVRYWESEKRKFKGKPDRCFTIRYKCHERGIHETVGWLSDGVDPQYASNIRGEIVQNIRTGTGFQSLKEKREIKENKQKAKMAEKKAIEQENIPFEILAQRYLEWSKGNKKSWKDDKSRLSTHIKPYLGHIPLKKIGIIQLEGFKKKLRSKGKSPQTILHCLQLIRAIFNRASVWGLYDGPNPVHETAKADKKFLSIPDSRRLRFLTHEEADILLEDLKLKSLQLHDMTLLSLHTGMRAGEIFSLIWADIVLDHGVIHIRDPKNDDTRQAYMTPPVEAMLSSKRPSHFQKFDLVFKDKRKGKKIREVSNLFSRIVDKLGWNKGVKDRRDRVVFHTLRHTYGSWLALQGTPLLTIKELLGHRKVEMTMRYAHLIPDQKRKAVLELAENQAAKIVELKKKVKRKNFYPSSKV